MLITRWWGILPRRKAIRQGWFWSSRSRGENPRNPRPPEACDPMRKSERCRRSGQSRRPAVSSLRMSASGRREWSGQGRRPAEYSLRSRRQKQGARGAEKSSGGAPTLAAVNAFTVPAGVRLRITDVVVSNSNPVENCCARLGDAGFTTPRTAFLAVPAEGYFQHSFLSGITY